MSPCLCFRTEDTSHGYCVVMKKGVRENKNGEKDNVVKPIKFPFKI